MSVPTGYRPSQTGQSRWAEHLTATWPAFVRELHGTLAVHSQYVLYGNIRDRFLVPPDTSGGRFGLKPLLPVLWQALQRAGFECLVCYDPVEGVYAYPETPSARRAASDLVGRGVLNAGPPDLDELRGHIAAAVGGPRPRPLPIPTRSRQSTTVTQAAPSGPPGAAQQTAPGAAAPAARSAPQIEGGALGGGWRADRPRAAFVVDYASRIARSSSSLEQSERDFFLFCLKLADTAQRDSGGAGSRGSGLFNPVLWLVENERDLPAWFTAGSERIRTISVPTPGLGERQDAGALLAADFYGVPLAPERQSKAQSEALARFVRQSEGQTLHAMLEVTTLAADRELGFDELPDALRIYTLGVEDNPWQRSHIRAQIREGEQATIPRRVKGQERAVTKTLDILKRAALGLSGAQASSSGNRPRGVLFFAGPTGVGKTELAKTVAESLFGDETAYLRFDMSEFAAEHSADRLAGAPPGYVGFEAGGELTGAVRARPFRVVLFDEIEKAHPRVMDKFLQILDEGRLTDGQGIVTYFSECVLIFTSNLGISRTNEYGVTEILVEIDTPYDELEVKVRAAIKDHFENTLRRPELLNRLGDNIVVFDFISESVAREIFDGQLGNIERRLEQAQAVHLWFADRAREDLAAACTADRLYGGRGIGNQLESRLVNPLARALFEVENLLPGSVVQVTRVGKDHRGAHVEITVEAPTPSPRTAGDT